MNEVFVNTEVSEQSNNPRYVKNTRRKRVFTLNETGSVSTCSELSDNIDSDLEREETIFANKRKKNNKEIANVDINKIDSIGNSNFKSVYQTHASLEIINDHVPTNGGRFKMNGKSVPFINSCTIDNYLYALWFLSHVLHTNQTFAENIPKIPQSNVILELIEYIDSNKWDEAREIWYLKMMNEDLSGKKIVDFFGEVEEFFINYMLCFQTHNVYQLCSLKCILNGNLIISENSGIINFAKLKNNQIGIVTDLSYKCSKCRNRVTCSINFKYLPSFLFMTPTTFFKIHEVPQSFQIQLKTYNLLCTILFLSSKRHFVSIFEYKNEQYLVDDLKPKMFTKLIKNSKHSKYYKTNVSSALYYLAD